MLSLEGETLQLFGRLLLLFFFKGNMSNNVSKRALTCSEMKNNSINNTVYTDKNMSDFDACLRRQQPQRPVQTCGGKASGKVASLTPDKLLCFQILVKEYN